MTRTLRTPAAGSRAGAASRLSALLGLRLSDADPLREPPHPCDADRIRALASQDPLVRDPQLLPLPQALPARERGRAGACPSTSSDWTSWR